MTQSPPILVTGAHRTGTTWVGKMLTASGEAAYISEPTNILHRPGVLSTPTRYWYTYICEQNQDNYISALHDMLRFHYHPESEIRAILATPRQGHFQKDFLRLGRDWSIFLDGWLRRKRPLLKDPFAVFSVPWFAERLGCQVVITIRHPAAFASSLKRLDWPFDFSHLLNQPLLMQNLLEPYREEMEKMAHDFTASANPDPIAPASLLWRIIYQVVAQYQQQGRPIFSLVRHEDLSIDPVEGYRDLYQRLGLNYTSRVQQIILNSSSSENPKEGSRENIYATRLDSQANLQNWKKRLSPEEIGTIRKLTEEVAPHYYPDQLW
jgi:hypothetical protein